MRINDTRTTHRRTARMGTLATTAVAAAAALAALAGCTSADEAPSGATRSPSVSAPAAGPGAESEQAVPVAIRDAWVKTTTSGKTGIFGTLVNNTGTETTAVAATSDAAEKMELHEVTSINGKRVMRPKKGGFAVPANGTHELRPGGDHLMLMGVTAPIRPGDEIPVTLTFKDGRTLHFTAVAKDFAGGNESYHPGKAKD